MGKRILPYSSWVAPDFVPETFGRLTTISSKYRPEGCKGSVQDFSCACGNNRTLNSNRVRSGITKSCGCLFKETRKTSATTHGKSKTPEYIAWRAMRDRCCNPNASEYPNYGGAGIIAIPEWLGRGGFERWLACIGPMPAPGMTQDRFPNQKGNYEPGNVRWATAEEQANNKTNNAILTHEGKTQTMARWAKEVGVTPSCLRSRIMSGMPMDEAITRSGPPSRNKRNAVWLTFRGERQQLCHWISLLKLPDKKTRACRSNAMARGHSWEDKVIEFIEKHLTQ